MGPGVKRHRRAATERHRAQVIARLATLPPSAKCEICDHCGVMPFPLDGIHCGLDSDNEGFAVVRPDQVCDRWKKEQKT